MLFKGSRDESKLELGLVSCSSIPSSKRDGRLKRICPPVLNLIKLLLTYNVEEEKLNPNNYNPFYDRFVKLPYFELSKIDFVRHIAVGAGAGKLMDRNFPLYIPTL
jgi:hypothetical protein